jgi:hypothetical protein
MKIEKYGEINILKKLIKSFKQAKKTGYIPVGFDSTTEWKRQNQNMFN